MCSTMFCDCNILLFLSDNWDPSDRWPPFKNTTITPLLLTSHNRRKETVTVGLTAILRHDKWRIIFIIRFIKVIIESVRSHTRTDHIVMLCLGIILIGTEKERTSALTILVFETRGVLEIVPIACCLTNCITNTNYALYLFPLKLSSILLSYLYPKLPVVIVTS